MGKAPLTSVIMLDRQPMGLPHPLQVYSRSSCWHAPQRVVAASLPDAQAPKQAQTWARVLLVSRDLQGLQ